MTADKQFTTSAEEIQRFLKSNLWRDFSEIARMRIAVIKNDMTTVGTIEQLKFLQGELQGLMFWLLFPESQMGELQREEEIKRKKLEKKEETDNA